LGRFKYLTTGSRTVTVVQGDKQCGDELLEVVARLRPVEVFVTQFSE
jgi:hypothetical protein